MRFRIPSTELSMLVALYVASNAWSLAPGVTVVGAATLALALACAALARVLGREVAPFALREVLLGSAACATVASAAWVTGSDPPSHALATIALVGRGAALAGALWVAARLASSESSRAHRAAVAVVCLGIAALPAVLHTRDPTLAAACLGVLPVVIAVTLTARHERLADPEARARLVLPATGAWFGVFVFGLAAWRSAEAASGESAIGTAALFVSLFAGLAAGAGGRGEAHAAQIARVTGGVAAAVATASIAARIGVGAALSGPIGALAGAATMHLWKGVRARTDSGRMLAATQAGETALGASARIEDIASSVLEPLRGAVRDLQAPAALWILEGERKLSLDVSGAAQVARLVPASERALLARLRAHPTEVIWTDALAPREVRWPEIRPVLERLREHGALAAVPLAEEGELMGVLLIARGRRAALPSLDEDRALRNLARRTADAVARASALERAHARSLEAHAESERARTECDDAVRGEARLRARLEGGRVLRAVGSLEETWVGYGRAMRGLEVELRAMAPHRGPVLIESEPGCHVMAVVRALHEASGREGGPCVVIDGATVHPRDALQTLVGGVLAGDPDDHEAEPLGWWEACRGGTLVIEHLAALGHDAHLALVERLRDAPDGSARLVVVATSGGDRLAGVTGELAERLQSLVLRVPPLRERDEDLETLVLFAIDRACRLLGAEAVGIRREALAALRGYAWPGNEAELFEALERAVHHASEGQIGLDALPLRVRLPVEGEAKALESREAERESYEAMERRILQAALDRTAGNKSEAARALGLARTTFLDKLRKFGLRD